MPRHPAQTSLVHVRPPKETSNLSSNSLGRRKQPQVHIHTSRPRGRASDLKRPATSGALNRALCHRDFIVKQNMSHVLGTNITVFIVVLAGSLGKDFDTCRMNESFCRLPGISTTSKKKTWNPACVFPFQVQGSAKWTQEIPRLSRVIPWKSPHITGCGGIVSLL